MTEIFPSLYLVGSADAKVPTPFTYLLRRPQGNILFATKADVSARSKEMLALGNVQYLLLGDRHHGAAHTEALTKNLGATSVCAQIEALVLKKSGIAINSALPYQRTMLAPDLEIIPTPGHTKGAFSYLWSNAGRRFLFIGDTLVPVDGTWQYWVTNVNRVRMLDTIEVLAGLSFDVILSNSFAARPRAWLEVTPSTRRAMFAALRQQLEA